MSIFEDVKKAITTREVAEYFGLKVSRNGMALCPFHKDTHPSLMLDERYYCFGCQETGDVIDFTAKYLGISKLDAAKKLAELFGTFPEKSPQRNPSYLMIVNKEDFIVDILCRYLRLLHQWKHCYAPQSPEEPMDDHFVESNLMTAMIVYLQSVLTGSDEALKERAIEILTKENWIYGLKARVEKEEQEVQQIERGDGDCA